MNDNAADGEEWRRLVAQTMETLRADREHGASWLAREAANLMARLTHNVPASDADARLAFVHDAAMQLAGLRPSMTPLANTVARVWMAGPADAGGGRAPSADKRLRRMYAETERLIGAWQTAAGNIAANARPLLGPVVYTLSRSGTVEAALTQLARDRSERRVWHVIVAESRPGGEGVAAAGALAEAGLAVALVPDTAAGAFIHEASAVVLGADSVRSDGSVVNKVGSYPLALVAREAGIPVYVLAETLKIAAPDFPLVYEPLEWPEMPHPPGPGVELRSVGFELVPSELVTAVITEEGALDPEQIAARAQAAGKALAALLGVQGH